MSSRCSVRWNGASRRHSVVGAFVAAPFAPDQFTNTPWFVWLIPVLCGLLLIGWLYYLLRPWISAALAAANDPAVMRPPAPSAAIGAALSGVGSVAPEAAPVAKAPEAPVVATSAEELLQWEADRQADTAPTAGPPPVADDLEVIEGIGPKIAGVFMAAGITTFAQLAAADIDHLKEVLHNGGMRLADPSSWPEQARLAAAGDWEGLKQLQETLRGGR